VSADRIRSHELYTYPFLNSVVGPAVTLVIARYGQSKQRNFKDEQSRKDFTHSLNKLYMVMWGCGDPKFDENCGSEDGLKRHRRIMDGDAFCQCIDFELVS
jgi:hypothetical protein